MTSIAFTTDAITTDAITTDAITTDAITTDAITVVGGTGGTSVALDDLAVAADRLAAARDEVTGLSARLGVLGTWLAGCVARLVVEAAARSGPQGAIPGLSRVVPAAASAATALAEAAGPRGALGEAVELGTLTLRVRAVRTLYATREVAVTAAMAGLRADVVGALAPPPTGGALARLVAAADPTHTVVPTMLPLAARALGVPWPPRSTGEAAALWSRWGALVGWLDERPGAEPVPIEAAAAATAPLDLAGLVGALDVPGREHLPWVRVTGVPQPDGSAAWVVQVPGTQVWSPRPGGNPLDLSSDVRLMAGQATAASWGVARALALAQRDAGRFGRGDPVLLAGHSQGGIVAARLASDPDFRRDQRVVAVVTAGSPVAEFPVPRDVRVLALQHRQDIVPALDLAPNPDRATWTTVHRDLRGDPDVRPHPAGWHEVTEYAQTAAASDRAGRDGSSESLRQWRVDTARFFAASRHGAPSVREYRLARVPEGGTEGR